jgi:hypothetical protein
MATSSALLANFLTLQIVISVNEHNGQREHPRESFQLSSCRRIYFQLPLHHNSLFMVLYLALGDKRMILVVRVTAAQVSTIRIMWSCSTSTG